MYDDAEYRRQKRVLDDKLQSLVVPEADVAAEAGKLVEQLPVLWEKADLAERHRILLTMLEAVYIDTVDEKSIVAIKPKALFKPIFQVAMMKEGSGIVLVSDRDLTKPNQPPPGRQEADESCSWWRRGRLHIPQLQTSPVIIPHRVPRSWAAYTVAWAA